MNTQRNQGREQQQGGGTGRVQGGQQQGGGTARDQGGQHQQGGGGDRAGQQEQQSRNEGSRKDKDAGRGREKQQR